MYMKKSLNVELSGSTPLRIYYYKKNIPSQPITITKPEALTSKKNLL